MKRYLMLLIAVVAVALVSAQAVKQVGVAYRYNGKDQRTPLGGVHIKVAAANGVLSKADGSFSLLLNNLQMGSRIGNVKVTKGGMMIFNKYAVEEWSVRKEPLRLILCDADEFEKQKANYIEIGRREAKKRYDRRLAELDKSYEAASKAKDDEYYQRLNELEEELANARKNMDEYADMFARIDESEIDTIAQKAIELFNRGELDEAIRMFEQGDYLEKLRADNRAISQADKMIATANRAKENAESDREKHIESIKAQANAYKLRNDWEKAGNLLKALADELDTIDPIIGYADYCRGQNNFAEAETYYRKAIDIVESNYDDKTSVEYLYLKGALCNDLGGLLNMAKNYDESELMQKNALSSYRKLYEYDPSLYANELAITLMNLGTLYLNVKDFVNSELMYKESLSLYRSLHENNPREYVHSLAMVLENLGTLYRYTKKYDESESEYMEAMSLYQNLYENNQSAYAEDLASVQMNIGILYLEVYKYYKSELMLKSSLSLYRKLQETNSNAYTSYLASVLMNLGILYNAIDDYEESKSMYEESLSLYQNLHAKYPDAYSQDLARVLSNLGSLYFKGNEYENGELLFRKSLSLYRKIYSETPDACADEFADVLTNLGILYRNTNNYKDSEALLEEALPLYRNLYGSDSSVYASDLAKVLMELGNLYWSIRNYKEGELMYKESLSLRRKMYENNPNMYSSDLASVLYVLGAFYKNCDDYENSKIMYSESLPLWRKLYEKDSRRYASVLAKTLSELGDLYFNANDYEKGALLNKEALPLYRKLYKEDPITYASDFIVILSYVIMTSENWSEIYNISLELVSVMKKLESTNPELYTEKYASVIGLLSYSSIFVGKYAEAEKYAREGLSIAPDHHIIQTNLALALLMQGRYSEAEAVYKQYKGELRDNFLRDFNELEEANAIPEERKADVERIKRLLAE